MHVNFEISLGKKWVVGAVREWERGFGEGDLSSFRRLVFNIKDWLMGTATRLSVHPAVRERSLFGDNKFCCGGDE